MEPTLTTVNVPKQYMGEMAIRRLVELITMEINSPVKIEIATNLVLRKSIK
jgi:LacI family transcriptional regulator